MRVESTIEISATPALVWGSISDPSRYLDFMSGITRWEVVGTKRSGLGARYRMLLRVGSAEVGGLIEIVEFARHADLAWTSITGVDQRGRWRLRPGNEGRSTVTTLRLSYGVAGSGISGWLAEQIAAPSVRGHLRRSLQQLKRQVEHEQLRSAAAERRRSRMGAA
jgi:uncharacterized membrane protein